MARIASRVRHLYTHPDAAKRRYVSWLKEPAPHFNGGRVAKVRDVLRLLRDNGWIVSRQRGSHRQLKHPTKPGVVTVAGRLSDDLAPGTFRSILKQAGLEP